MTKSIDIRNEINELNRLNDFLEQSMSGLGLNEMLFMNLKLAIEEVVVNTITYGYPEKKKDFINIRLEYDVNRLKVVITDSGIAFDLTSKKEPDVSLPLEERPIGGLGTYLVKQLMTEVSYKRDGNRNILTMIKDI